jgi:hypothetical protein
MVPSVRVVAEIQTVTRVRAGVARDAGRVIDTRIPR